MEIAALFELPEEAEIGVNDQIMTPISSPRSLGPSPVSLSLDPILSPNSRRAEYECCCCFHEYNLRSYPPICSSLCPHSVCIYCVEKIWKKNNSRYICPLCRIVSHSCPDRVNYSLIGSLHRTTLISPSHTIDSEAYLPLVFLDEELHEALSCSGQLRAKTICASTYSVILRNMAVSVTTFSDCFEQQESLRFIIQENMRQLGQLKHDNVELFVGFSSNESLCQAIITERYQDSLSDKLFNGGSLTAQQRYQIARGVAMGIQYLHNFHSHSIFRQLGEDFPLYTLFEPRSLVHGNLTSENIQLYQQPNSTLEYVPRICNISIMSIIRRYMQTQSLQFTLSIAGYAAPESRYGHYDQKADVYSFGVILIELLTSRQAISIMELMERGLSSTNTAGFINRFKERYLDPVFRTSTEEKLWVGLFDIAKLCLLKSKDERLDANGVVEALNTLDARLAPPVEEAVVLKKGSLKLSLKTGDVNTSARRSTICSSSSRTRATRTPLPPPPPTSSRRSEGGNLSRRRAHPSPSPNSPLR